MLDQTDYDLLAQAEKDVRSEMPFLLVSVVVLLITVVFVIVSTVMWIRALEYLLGALACINAASTFLKVVTARKLIHELESRLERNIRLFIEESVTYSKEERNA